MLDGMDSVGFVENLARQQPEKHDEDYTRDGILFCGTCGEPKQAWIDWFPDADGNAEKKLVRIMCKCDLKREQEEKDRKARADFEERMLFVQTALHTMKDDVRWRFDMDENPNNTIAKTCRVYVAEWEKMKRENVGILFYGTKGSGKTFYATCIYNALKEKQILVGFTTAPNLMNILGKWDKTEIFDAITRPQLLVIDDLGAERSGSYSAELMYSVIDARYKTGKPTVVTTNMDKDDMEKEEDMWRSRIYDRIIEMCPIPLKFESQSKRKIIANERKQLAREVMLQAAEFGGR